jgi:sulfide:quinone oxidoreductase
VIAGGGVAAVEAMLALRDLAGDRVELQLCAPRSEFVLRPYAVAEPFGAGEVTRLDLSELAAGCGAEFLAAGATGVSEERRRLILHGGREIPYDHLVIACGTKSIQAVSGAVQFWGVSDDPGIGDLVGELERGEVRSVVFTSPGGPGWPLPLYELPLLARAHLETAGAADPELTIVTSEDAPLQIFGLRTSDAVRSLLESRGIRIVTATRPVKFEGGALEVVPAGSIETERVVSLPALEGRRLAGVPHDASGFLRVDPHGRVTGMERVFAAGDVIDFPIKHGGLATQQADAAAEQIAADIGISRRREIDPRPFEPSLQGMLLTGEDPKFISGALTGGRGETSLFSDRALWGPSGKVGGLHLGPLLARRHGAELQPSLPEMGS